MTMMPELKITWAIFLLTCLLRGMTRQGKPNGQDKHISTHMPLARHDPAIMAGSFFVLDFYSHASCEAWPCGSTLPRHLFQISTHMPLARHDPLYDVILRDGVHFYSHASCEAWRIPGFLSNFWQKFLLTCLLRGMTWPLFDGTYSGI